MKEANIFEAWAERLVEGTWQTPDTPEKQAKLLELMSTDLPVGADATNATEQLYDLLGDDELFDRLEELAERDANADARQVIFDRMQMLSNDPDVRKVIEQLNIDPTAEMNPPEATNPSDLEPMNESRMLDEDGSKLEHILDRFKYEVRHFEQGGDLDRHLYDALYDYYVDAGEMPYGVQKAREGDPMEWVAQNLESHLSGGGIVGGNPDEDYGIERESVMHGDYAEEKSRIRELAGLPPEETDEGVLGTVGGAMGGGMLGTLAGGALGGMLGGPAGAVLGATAGQGIGTAAGAVGGQELTKGGSSLIEKDEEETDEGWKGQLAGGTVGTLAGGALGAVGGPIGSMVGGALGGTAGQMIGDKLGGNEKEETDEGELGTAIGAGLGGVVGGIPGAALGGIAGHYLSKDDDKKQTKEGVVSDLAKSAGEVVGDIAAAPTTAATSFAQAASNPFGKKETDEGVRGALAGGALGGAATRSVKGAVTGAKLGSAIQDRFAKKNDSSPLAGKYGHSGKMKPVDKDLSFLDRLKELSGMKK